MNTVRLDRISAESWEHPADARALGALRALPGFDVVVRKVQGPVSRLTIEPILRRGAVAATESSHPALLAAWRRVCRTFDIEEPWELLVIDQGRPNAAAVGVGPPIVVVTRGLLDLLDGDEDGLAVVLGHEVGHILSDHGLYKALLSLLLSAGWMAFSVPLAPLVMVGLIAGLREWDRKSELSADRASLLVVGDPAVVVDTLRRVQPDTGGAGTPPSEGDGRPAEDAADRLRQLASAVAFALVSRHPMTETRVEELLAWQASGAPERIRAGDYPRRASEPQTRASTQHGTRPPWEAWREPIADLQKQAAAAAGPAERWLRDARHRASASYDDAVGWIREAVGDRGEE